MKFASTILYSNNLPSRQHINVFWTDDGFCFLPFTAAVIAGEQRIISSASVWAEEILRADKFSRVFNNDMKSFIQVAGLERFGQKFRYAGVAGGEDAALFTKASHQDNRYEGVWAGFIVADPARQGYAVAGLHHPVGNNEIRLILTIACEGFIAVFCVDNRAYAEGFEDGVHQVQHGLVVLYDQYF